MADQRFRAAAEAEVIIGSRSNDLDDDGTWRRAAKSLIKLSCSTARRVSCHLPVPSLVVTLFWLWSRSTDHPCLPVSGISLLMCSYMHSWIVSLSDGAMGASDFLTRVSCTVLLALYVNHAATPFAAMVALYFTTVYTAGLLGHAIAEHRQRHGRDTCVIETVIGGPRKRRPAPPFGSMSFLSLALATRALWVACTYAPGDAAAAVVVELSLTTTACVYLWAGIVHVWLLHASLVSGDCLIMLFTSGAMVFWVVAGVLDDLFGDYGFVCLAWLTVMANAGYLGYMVGIYQRFEQRLRLEKIKLLQKGKDENERAEEEQRAESDEPKPIEGRAKGDNNARQV